MKIVVQRSGHSKVEVQGKVISEIRSGLVLLVCLEKGDAENALIQAADKVSKMRIFQDENGKMNLNISQAGGAVLAISQFTLSWNGQKGNRPSFDLSMSPEEAPKSFDQFCQLLEEEASR